jgi:hypothetical protein
VRGENSAEDLLTLQQSFGNKAVGSLLSRGAEVPPALAAVQRFPWDDWFGGGSKGGGGGAGGADAKGGGGGAGGDSGPKGGFGGAEAKGAGGAGGGKGPGGVPHGEMPWGKMWKMYEGIKEDRKALDNWPPSAVMDGEAEREEEPWTAY